MYFQRNKNYTYILECEDGSYYTGWTNDLGQRYEAHCSGKGAKYTRAHKPVKIAYYEISKTKEEAMRREWQIKQLDHAGKQKLIGSSRNRMNHRKIAK
jgi:putative endonuclease